MEWLNVPGASALSFAMSFASGEVSSRTRKTVKMLNTDSKTGSRARKNTVDEMPPINPYPASTRRSSKKNPFCPISSNKMTARMGSVMGMPSKTMLTRVLILAAMKMAIMPEETATISEEYMEFSEYIPIALSAGS